MADGRVSQSIIEFISFQERQALAAQSIIEFITVLGIDCGNPPLGQLQAPYSHTFPAGSGDPPYTFAIIAGALPPGLTLDPSSGVVSGIPTEVGTFAFTISVTDSFGATDSVSCTIRIINCLVTWWF